MDTEKIQNSFYSFYFMGEGRDFVNLLKESGFKNPEESSKSFLRILKKDEHLSYFTEILPDLIISLQDSPDSGRALINFEKFAHSGINPISLFCGLKENPALIKLLTDIFSFSHFLSEVLIKNPEYYDWLIQPETLDTNKDFGHFLKEANLLLEGFKDKEGLRNALCRFKRKELLRIGVRDLIGKTSLDIITRELSDLAAAILEVSLKFCREETEYYYGIPHFPNPQKKLQPCGFVILGMGKLGGGELNFSSDIDIIFVYEEEGFTIPHTRQASKNSSKIKTPKSEITSPPSKTKKITNHKFFTILGEELTKFLSEPTSEGMLFRVDLRLRPEGITGPLVRALESFGAYFYSQARLWEKLVYLKASPVAGDLKLGEKILKIADSFIFENPEIDSLVNEISLMKSRIDREVLNSKNKDREIKRGVGGIREIEFIVYLLQILHGNHNQKLRTQNFFKTIKLLFDLKIMPGEDYDGLHTAYLFLRKIEHRLQMMEEIQTHLLPERREDLQRLALSLGFKHIKKESAEDLFLKKYYELTGKVHSLFEKYFKEGEGKPRQEIEILLDPDSKPDECFEVLKRYRFKELAIERCFKRLAFGTGEYYLPTQGQKFFERILPTLLNYASQTPFPDQAIRNFENFVESAKGISSYYSTIAENPGIIKLLLRLFGTSNYLSRTLIAHPEYFDEIVDPGMLETLSYPTEDLKNFFNKVPSGADVETELSKLRKRKRLEFLKIGIRDVLELYSAPELSLQMTHLAEGCLNSCVKLLRKNLENHYGKPLILKKGRRESKFCIAGMGGFGAGELTYFSDLDVIFFYEDDGKTNGKEKISNYQFFTLLAEDISQKFSTITPEDYLYKLDARLRPEGTGSPLLISASRLIDYYKKSAQVWEYLAFLRFRPVAGDIDFGNRVRGGILKTIERKVGKKIPLNEIGEMKEKIERNIHLPITAFADLKRGAGGLFDIEFIMHTLQLIHSKSYKDLFNQNTTDVLNRLREYKLLSDEKVDTLIEGYKYFRKVQSKIRLLFESPNNYIPTSDKLEPLEISLEFSPHPKTSLLDTYLQFSRSIRGIFNEVMNRK